MKESLINIFQRWYREYEKHFDNPDPNINGFFAEEKAAAEYVEGLSCLENRWAAAVTFDVKRIFEIIPPSLRCDKEKKEDYLGWVRNFCINVRIKLSEYGYDIKELPESTLARMGIGMGIEHYNFKPSIQDTDPLNPFNDCIADNNHYTTQAIREGLKEYCKDKRAADIVKTFAVCCYGTTKPLLKKCPSYEQAQEINKQIGKHGGYDRAKRTYFIKNEDTGIYEIPTEKFIESEKLFIKQTIAELKHIFSKHRISSPPS